MPSGGLGTTTKEPRGGLRSGLNGTRFTLVAHGRPVTKTLREACRPSSQPSAVTEKAKKHKGVIMPRKKKELGRPARALPPKTDATPEELATAMFALPAHHEWKYLGEERPDYKCGACGKAVSYPNVLTRAGLCGTCARA